MKPLGYGAMWRKGMGIKEKLTEAIKTAEEREKVYGVEAHSGHTLTGAALAELFPDGVTLKTAEDFTRFLIFSMMMTKIGRYAVNFDKGGHKDSAHDCGIYSLILEDTDDSYYRK
jgi:hypothetical protein